MAYQCPKCKLLFSSLPERCPECAGAVTADQRLDRYYLADGFRKYTGPVTPAPQTPPTPKPAPVEKPAQAVTEPPVTKSATQPKIQDEDTLAALRNAYYRQHGGNAEPAQPEQPTPPAASRSFFDDPTPPPSLTDLPPDPEPDAPTPPPSDPPPVSVNSGSFFNDPGPAPYVPDLLEDPDPTPDPTPEPAPDPEPAPPVVPLPRQRTPRSAGGFGFWNAMASIRWGCVFRVLLVLLAVGLIAALWANRAAIFDGILSLIASLLPAALVIGGIIYLLRSLFRGR